MEYMYYGAERCRTRTIQCRNEMEYMYYGAERYRTRTIQCRSKMEHMYCGVETIRRRNLYDTKLYKEERCADDDVSGHQLQAL